MMTFPNDSLRCTGNDTYKTILLYTDNIYAEVAI